MIFGVIPLDIIMHFIGGIVLTITIKKFSKKATTVYLVILIACILKEYYDSSIMTWNVPEALEDTAYTFIYPVLIHLVAYLKKA